MAVNFTAKQACAIAIRYTNLTNSDPRILSIRMEDGLYHLIIRAAFLDYEFYLDARTGSILGLLTQPAAENDCSEAAAAA